MQIHTISSSGNKRAKRVGRGGKRGTYSGRGIKGQRARSGRRIRPQLRDILKKIPKKRGYRFTSFRTRPFGINLSSLEKTFNAGDAISPAALVKKGLVRKQGKKNPPVKILGTGEITKKFTVEGCAVSASAKEKLERAGGIVKPYAKDSSHT
jgi:large subunit ribosomal protein L15